MPNSSDLQIIGWREWVCLSDMGIKSIKAKVDSGARSSSIHAFDIRDFTRDGKDWVRFKVHPIQNREDKVVRVETEVIDVRKVRSSSGKATMRPVITTNITLLGVTWPVELTLADRAKMKFRMLLGRQAFRGRFLLDVNRSFYGGAPKRKKKKK